MRGRVVLFAAFATACATQRPPPPSKESAPEAPPDPLAAFTVRGEPAVETLTLDPLAAWRFVASRVTTARAEAQALDEELLLTFEKGALHQTRSAGRRRTWLLPEGLVLEGVPRHLLLRPDLSSRLLPDGGMAVAEAGWETVVKGRMAGGDGNVAEFRLEAKDGREFRSMQETG